MTMDIIAIQKILSDAAKEHELIANGPIEVFITLTASDLYRKLTAKTKPKS